MCLKLNLSKEAITEKQNHELPHKETSCSKSYKFSPAEKNNGITRKSSSDGSVNSKLTKTPSSIPRELIGDGFSPSPTLARSPAMHEGFRTKDWKVERTPINTPDSLPVDELPHPPQPPHPLPLLSDDDEEPEDTDSVNRETDPISKAVMKMGFLLMA